MELMDFLEGEFALYFKDADKHLVISTTDRVKKHKGPLDEKNPPKEETLEVPKGKFARVFKAYAENIGYKKMVDHPSRFVKDYGLDTYRGECITPASRYIKEWSELK